MASASLGRLALAALGIIAYQNRDKIAQMLKGPTRDRRDQAQDGGIADVVGGLGEIIDRFRNAGNGSAADSWVSTGPNEAIEPAQVEKALDPETLEALTNQTGLSREEILQRLAINLPEAVDAATPASLCLSRQQRGANPRCSIRYARTPSLASLVER
jgi:uncharacterized protein YidB (DUF937 family)